MALVKTSLASGMPIRKKNLAPLQPLALHTHLRSKFHKEEVMKVTEERVLPTLLLLPVAAIFVGALVVGMLALFVG